MTGKSVNGYCVPVLMMALTAAACAPAVKEAGLLPAAGRSEDRWVAGTLARPRGQDIDVVVLTAARLGRARLIDNVQCRATGAIVPERG
mgnify:CR=1 FL=1